MVLATKIKRGNLVVHVKKQRGSREEGKMGTLRITGNNEKTGKNGKNGRWRVEVFYKPRACTTTKNDGLFPSIS